MVGIELLGQLKKVNVKTGSSMFAFQDDAMFYSELFKDINKNFDQSKESKAKIQDNKSSWPV